MSQALNTDDLATLREQFETAQAAIDARGPGVADDGPYVLLTFTKAAGERLLEEVERLQADRDSWRRIAERAQTETLNARAGFRAQSERVKALRLELQGHREAGVVVEYGGPVDSLGNAAIVKERS